jgi:hypothetical protein
VRQELAEDLEEFVRAGQLWSPADLGKLIARLEEESDQTGDPLPRMLAKPLGSVLTRLEIGEVDSRFANDVEGIVYPRLWKVMEAIWDHVPDGEMRTRIEVLNRRLARRFAEERP